jgi:hypothetical protein
VISTAWATKLGWCSCCRRPDQPACGGLPQSKNYWSRRIHSQSVFLWCGSQFFRQTGRNPAGWFNHESQTRESSNTGITIIWSRRNCASSFLLSPAVASAKGYFGTWLCSMESRRDGRILHLPSQMAPSSMQRPFLKRGLLGFRAELEVEMDNSSRSNGVPRQN